MQVPAKEVFTAEHLDGTQRVGRKSQLLGNVGRGGRCGVRRVGEHAPRMLAPSYLQHGLAIGRARGICNVRNVLARIVWQVVADHRPVSQALCRLYSHNLLTGTSQKEDCVLLACVLLHVIQVPRVPSG